MTPKNIFIFIIILIFYFSNIVQIKATNETCFIVTAYYSPLPNQSHYFKWDYFLEKILNWNWTNWASWKPVFSWMLRAPKNYEFWTKIFIPWLWVWEVSDRWWAIVASDAPDSRWYLYDRIDVWMWYWEKGLARALTWWKKTICWAKIMPNDTKNSIDINNIPRDLSVLDNLDKSEINIFAIDIWVESPIEHTKKLHEYLNSIWLYNWNINSKYNKDTVIAVYKFQLKNWIVNSPKNNWAWIWWEQTRYKAKLIEDQKKALFSKNQSKKNNNLNHNVLSKNITPESKNEDIKELQDFFTYLWLYKWKITWNFEDIKEVIINYQLKNNIIKSKDDEWAWYFWPKTRKIAFNDYIKKQNEEKISLIKKSIDEKVKNFLNSIWSPKRWQTWENVRSLQKLLSILWYFKVKDTAIFWQITTNAIINYQIDKWIIKSKNDIWAWIFGPKTKESLKNDLTQILINQALKKQNMIAYKN